MPDFDTLAASLRRWADMLAPHDRAAVLLLIKDETWPRRRDFQAACLRYDEEEGLWYIPWLEARQFLDSGPRGHSTALTMLRLAVTLAFDDLDLRPLGRVHRQWIVTAVAEALDVDLAALAGQQAGIRGEAGGAQ